MGDVDDRFRFGYAAFGEVEQRRAAGEQHRARLERGLAGLIGGSGTEIGKFTHQAISAASRTAATMPL
jgi:hypothetical protein